MGLSPSERKYMTQTGVVRILLLGRGNVGKAFEVLLAKKTKQIARLTGGQCPVICGIVTSTNQDDFYELLPQCDIVVELVGQSPNIYEWLCRALQAGKPVITANKELMSIKGHQLHTLARNNGVEIYCEAAVCGAIPILSILQGPLEVIRINRLLGIINGTTNLILEMMTEEGISYSEALEVAQQKGYAERDPTADVTGADAAAKAVILTRLAFGVHIEISQVSYQGVTGVTGDDIKWANRLGFVIKLIASVERVKDRLAIRVVPTFVSADHPLASIHGANNAVTLESPEAGQLTFSGPGAGGFPTASAVIGNLVAAIRGIPGSMPEAINRTPLMTDFVSSHYLHLRVLDQERILLQVARLLADHHLSISTMKQANSGSNQAELGIITHPGRENDLLAVISQLTTSPFVVAPPRFMAALEL